METEVPYLKMFFSPIIVVPGVISGALRSLPEGVSVETSFADTYCGKKPTALLRKAGRALLYPSFYSELWRAPKKPAYLRKLLGYASEAQRCRLWFKNYLRSHPELRRALVYTYWFYDQATGIVSLKKEYPELTVASRAHGFDLYEEDYFPQYIPFRPQTLQAVDKLICISDHGLSYLSRRFPAAAVKSKVSRLGVEDPGFILDKRSGENLIIASCSHLIPLKRIHLQVEGIASFAKKHPDVPVEWHLIGDGPLREKISSLATERFPASVKWSLKGHLPNKEVFALYKALQPDLFILTSETEGLPVSLMEAHACGIPAIATTVGGIPEIVNNDNGRLLPADPSPHEISEAIASVLPELEVLKANARLNWYTHYNASRNYTEFAKILH